MAALGLKFIIALLPLRLFIHSTFGKIAYFHSKQGTHRVIHPVHMAQRKTGHTTSV